MSHSQWRRSCTKICTSLIIGLGVLAWGVSNAAALPGPERELSGDWGTFSRCPVDDPTMLAADGETNIALCMAITTRSGTMTIGKITVPTGGGSVQAGLVINNETSGVSLVSPKHGALVAAPAQLPGGLQALICPGADRSTYELVCRHHRNFGPVFATLESAGEPTNFNLAGALGDEEPLMTLPVKIHVENPLLGPACYIGTDRAPISLRPANLAPPTTFNFSRFDPDGTPDQENGPLALIELGGSNLGDSSFVVPGASRCGFGGHLNRAIDENIGLPSPAGANKIELAETAADLTGFNEPSDVAPNAGETLARDWRSAVIHGRR